MFASTSSCLRAGTIATRLIKLQAAWPHSYSLRTPHVASTLLQAQQRHHFGHLANKPPPTPTEPKPSPSSKPDIDTVDVSKAEQRRSDWTIIKRLLENVWPKNDWKTRGTVVFGLGLLIGGKVRSLAKLLGAVY